MNLLTSLKKKLQPVSYFCRQVFGLIPSHQTQRYLEERLENAFFEPAVPLHHYPSYSEEQIENSIPKSISAFLASTVSTVTSMIDELHTLIDETIDSAFSHNTRALIKHPAYFRLQILISISE